jgi:hypothetical protein
VCALGKPMCLLFEFMARGDLSTYLRASAGPQGQAGVKNGTLDEHSGGGGGGDSSLGDAPGKLSHIEQINIAKQVNNYEYYVFIE